MYLVVSRHVIHWQPLQFSLFVWDHHLISFDVQLIVLHITIVISVQWTVCSVGAKSCATPQWLRKRMARLAWGAAAIFWTSARHRWVTAHNARTSARGKYNCVWRTWCRWQLLHCMCSMLDVCDVAFWAWLAKSEHSKLASKLMAWNCLLLMARWCSG